MLLGLDAIPAMMLGFVATAPVLAVMFVLRGREARRTAIPLGPFLALGAAIVLLGRCRMTRRLVVTGLVSATLYAGLLSAAPAHAQAPEARRTMRRR